MRWLCRSVRSIPAIASANQAIRKDDRRQRAFDAGQGADRVDQHIEIADRRRGDDCDQVVGTVHGIEGGDLAEGGQFRSDGRQGLRCDGDQNMRAYEAGKIGFGETQRITGDDPFPFQAIQTRLDCGARQAETARQAMSPSCGPTIRASKPR